MDTRRTMPDDPYKYPPIEPYESGLLSVGGLHRIYYELSGNPDGIPVVDVHGGPGAGSVSDYRRLFDPNRYHICLYDQRGCGRSEPLAEVRENTTQDLLSDMEALRSKLGVDSWIVTGWSWGTTLALAYAQAHTAQTRALVLRGTWTARQEEADWFETGLQNFFPDTIERLEIAGGDTDPQQVLQRLFDVMLDEHAPVEDRERAARDCIRRELYACYLDATDELIEAELDREPQLPGALIGAHYWQHRWFLEENELWTRLDRIAHIPCVIIHGRYDVVAMPRTSWELHQAWPGSELFIVPRSGHMSSEPEMARVITETMDQLADRFG